MIDMDIEANDSCSKTGVILCSMQLFELYV